MSDKYLIEGSTLRGLADAIRKVAGTDRSYTPTEMIEAVTTILENGAYILVDENGLEIPAVFVEEVQAFTATANDIRLGYTAATEAGFTTGTMEIPAYYVSEGTRVIRAGEEFLISVAHYDYKKLQAIICPFNTSLSNSVSAEKVVINDSVYAVSSTVTISTIVKDHDRTCVDLGITNETDKRYLIRYFMYKEVY